MEEKRYIILRYGEINLKGKNRNYFDRILLNNINKKIKDENVKLQKSRNRIIIAASMDDANRLKDKFQKIPGIENISIGTRVESDLDAISQKAVQLFDQSKPKFRVSTKRSDKRFPLTSQETSRQVGGEILKANDGLEGLKVSLRDYDQEIKIEILEDYTYIFHKTLPGMGGLPVGTSGRALVLLSGGIDSPVAAIEAMKRGIKVDCTHFYTPPYTTQKALDKVNDLVDILREYDEDINLFTFNITDLQLEIKNKCKDSYGLILMRRMMFRKVSDLVLKDGYQMIITGESIGQVASQTIENLSLTNMLSAVPIIRPLITHNKQEIITKAQIYNTYETSIKPYDDACSVFAPKRPQIKGELEDVLVEENKLDYETFLESVPKETYEKKEKKEKLNDFI